MKTGQIYTVALIVLTATFLYGCYYDEIVTFEGVPTGVSLKNDVMPIFQQNCNNTGCHDAGPAHDPSLVEGQAYDALIDGGYVNTLDPANSQLYKIIESGSMPPSGALDPNDQLIILGWITDGAPDN